MATQRYPADFGVTGPSVDYIEMQFIRRDYTEAKVRYKQESSLDKILFSFAQILS